MSKETREYAKQLVSQMTLEEKMSQMVYQSPAIERLGIPAYNWWNEALHGVARAGVVVFAVEFFDKVVKIDDPVGAISVHGVCGALGTLFTGIFGEGCSFITQMIGFVAVAAYTLILAFILFFVLKKTIGLRVTEKEEIDGLDMHEHGCSAYANFHFHNDK